MPVVNMGLHGSMGNAFHEEMAKVNASKEGNAQDSGTVYSRSAFNEYGDVSFERQTRKYTLTKESVLVPDVNAVCTDRLNDLNRYVTNRGTSLVIAAYPVAYGEFTPPEEDYVRFQKKLLESVDCPVISDYRDYFPEYDYFYDTEYHLTQKGADLRTRQLIRDLKKWMAE